MKKINVLVLGAGVMGRMHLKAYKKIKHVEVIGVVDHQPNKIRENKEEQFFTSFENAFNKCSGIDVVDICLPTPLHKKFIKKAARLGKDIICEKPLALSLDDVQEIIKICERYRVKLFVGHVGRFFPAYERAKELIDSGAIGQASVLRMTRNSRFPITWNDWYKDEQKSGGLILDLLIHDFDFLRWCFGEVKRVYAKAYQAVNEKQVSYSLVTLRFESGAIAHIEGSWSNQPFATSFELSGNEGMITYDSRQEQTIEHIIYGQSGSTFSSPTLCSPYEKELNHFIDCIMNNKTPIILPKDASESVKISLAALESIKLKRPVELEYFI